MSAQDLTVSRGGTPLFDGISLDIAPGQVFGITGPSGCGKSSLGDALLGLIKPDRGRVTRRAGDHPHALQKLYQDPVAAFPRKRTIGKTLADTVPLSGRKPNDVDALLDRLGLDPALLRRRPGAVSGDELQRLSLLRVLLRAPSFLFADEPTSRLDPITQARIIRLMTDIAETDGLALMLVSHHVALIRNTADTALALGPTGAVDVPDRATLQKRAVRALQ